MSSDIEYGSLSARLIEAVPELIDEYEHELEDWEGEIPGPHIVYADILIPFLDRLIGQKNEERLQSIFVFLESLVANEDPRIGDVVALSVLDPLRNRRSKELWLRYLGPKLIQMLDQFDSS